MAHHIRLSSLSLAVALFFLDLMLPAAAAAASTKGHVHLPFNRVGTLPTSTLSKRDGSSPSIISSTSDRFAYVAKVKVGTPGQDMTLLISTSTGQTWVQDASSAYCEAGTEWKYSTDDPYADPVEVERPSMCTLGSFNKNESSTFLNANQQYSEFYIYSNDVSTVYGKNFTDKLVVGDVELPDVSMGLVQTSTLFTGTLGLGYNTSDSMFSSSSGWTPSFMDRLVGDGHVTTRAFSMWLDDAQGEGGNLLFGAVDQSRYEGDLLRVKAFSDYAFQGTIGVTVHSFEAASDSKADIETVRSNDFPLGATLGPGEIVSYLPTSIYNKIVELTGAEFDADTGATFISCDAAETNNARFTFRLSGADGPVLNFETADLVIPKNVYPATGPYMLELPPGENMCILGVQERNEESYNYYNLGSSILRRSFLTFDLENQELAVAPVKFKLDGDSATPTIVPFEHSGAPVPSASLYCGDSACIEYCEYSYCQSPVPTPSSSSDARHNPTSNFFPDDDDKFTDGPGFDESGYWQTVALGVGVGLGLVILAAGIALVIIWGRICRGEVPGAGKDVEDEGEQRHDAPPSMSMGGSTGMRMEVPPGMSAPGTLPVIREGREDAASGAPQLPNLAQSRALSAEDVPATPAGTAVAPPAPEEEPPKPPKGKGVEADDNRI